jgi:hypothetical protein
MTINPAEGTAATANGSVTEWLLDSDPSIRWQVMRDLLGAPEQAVATERARVVTEGVGARLLAMQRPDGLWAGAAPRASGRGDHFASGRTSSRARTGSARTAEPTTRWPRCAS